MLPNVPFSETALRIASEYLAKLADNAAAIRAEAGEASEWVTVTAVAQDAVHAAPAVEQLHTPEPEQPAAVVPPPPPAAVAQPDPAPEPVYELQPTQKCDESGYTLDQYRDNGWSDEQLIGAELAAWVEVEAPFIDAPGASNAPPPPPAASAPAASNTSGAAVPLDKDGLPWDSRIHSDAAEKLTQKGVWKRKRGVSDALVAQVEAELRAVLGKSATAAPTPTVAPAATVPPAASAGNVRNFGELSQYIASLLKAGKITSPDTVAAVQSVGLQILPDMAKPENAGHIPAVVQFLKNAAGL